MIMTNDIIVTVRDVRAAGMCLIPGARDFFKRHNLDWRDFIKNGILASELRKTGDAMALQVIKVAYGRQ